ncbi:uncharacterized protein At5g39570-like, partial [Hevea brasiliensis]|uniref:uncharacterized protein At5g39570-like n=1 Tax=Hevea brasiliensis TaxID=3981 RepID=UPI0025E9422E
LDLDNSINLLQPTEKKLASIPETDIDEYDPTPYGGGYDIALTYGRPIPPSDETCYQNSSLVDEIDYDRPNFTSYAEPSAYADERLQEEYTSYARPKPRLDPSYGFVLGAAAGREVFVDAKPEPAYGFQTGVSRPGFDYGSGGYGGRPKYEKPPILEYGSGYGRMPDSEYLSGGYGWRPEYDDGSRNKYGYGSEEGYSSNKYGDDDSDDEKKKHNRYQHHHHRKHYDDD